MCLYSKPPGNCHLMWEGQWNNPILCLYLSNPSQPIEFASLSLRGMMVLTLLLLFIKQLFLCQSIFLSQSLSNTLTVHCGHLYPHHCLYHTILVSQRWSYRWIWQRGSFPGAKEESFWLCRNQPRADLLRGWIRHPDYLKAHTTMKFMMICTKLPHEHSIEPKRVFSSEGGKKLVSLQRKI